MGVCLVGDVREYGVNQDIRSVWLARRYGW